MSNAEWPTVSVLILTYNRMPIVMETVRLLKEYLVYAGPLKFVVSDDGSDDGTQAALLSTYPDIALVQNHRVGLGAIANRGLERCWADGDFVLQLQDDMQLQSALDLAPHVRWLQEVPTCGFIRLWGCGGHNVWANLETKDLPDVGIKSMWRIWFNSPELYIPSDRPHIKHGRFHKTYGYYPEGLKTGETEEVWSHAVKDASGRDGKQMDVFIPHSLEIESLFVHCGWHQRWRDVGL